jgi:hypothetical protein
MRIVWYSFRLRSSIILLATVAVHNSLFVRQGLNEKNKIQKPPPSAAPSIRPQHDRSGRVCAPSARWDRRTTGPPRALRLHTNRANERRSAHSATPTPDCRACRARTAASAFAIRRVGPRDASDPNRMSTPPIHYYRVDHRADRDPTATRSVDGRTGMRTGVLTLIVSVLAALPSGGTGFPRLCNVQRSRSLRHM